MFRPATAGTRGSSTTWVATVKGEPQDKPTRCPHQPSAEPRAHHQPPPADQHLRHIQPGPSGIKPSPQKPRANKPWPGEPPCHGTECADEQSTVSR
ncbi:hypothetical protein Afil01_08540 [Actinorhabdospora filicis]|uniref:Uncharacterized protein n=1 Tax=Actinorhabdospora filicis TaxID=1785913 RepID=A0A9W6SHH1_9ACTN|nr:hypothetical protein Afil01_08540 [Actinorhabdospora filicis]